MTHARLQGTAFLLIDAITALRHGWTKAPIARRRRSQFPAVSLTAGPEAGNTSEDHSGLVLQCEANWLICNIEMDIGDALRAGCRDALIIVDAHPCLAPTGEKWDDRRGNFLFLSRWCVIVWATVRGGWGGWGWVCVRPLPPHSFWQRL